MSTKVRIKCSKCLAHRTFEVPCIADLRCNQHRCIGGEASFDKAVKLIFRENENVEMKLAAGVEFQPAIKTGTISAGIWTVDIQDSKKTTPTPPPVEVRKPIVEEKEKEPEPKKED